MNIQKRLQIEFEFVGEEQISGNTALKIVNDVFKDAQTNQRIIEELEKFTKDEFNYTYGDEYIEGVNYVQHRINQLKQTI
tara:strand:- start:278 stop:517 length:240 start_codon:yes stop_codon:yes gene_type:complete